MSVSKDQSVGRVKQAKGTIKEVAGKVRGDGKLEARGKVQRIGSQRTAPLSYREFDSLRVRFEAYGGFAASQGAGDGFGGFAAGKNAEGLELGAGPEAAFQHGESLKACLKARILTRARVTAKRRPRGHIAFFLHSWEPE